MRVVLAVLVGLLGLVAVFSGLSGMALGPSDVVYPTFALDSNFRFLSAFLTGAGVILLWSLWRLAQAGRELRIVCALVFVGGCARLLSLTTAGRPDAAYALLHRRRDRAAAHHRRAAGPPGPGHARGQDGARPRRRLTMVTQILTGRCPGAPAHLGARRTLWLLRGRQLPARHRSSPADR